MVLHLVDLHVPTRQPSRAVAALLALLFPGVGHAYSDRLGAGVAWWLLVDVSVALGLVVGAFVPSAMVWVVWARLGLALLFRLLQVASAAAVPGGAVRRPWLAVGFFAATWVATFLVGHAVRATFAEPFKEPSGSMTPSLLAGDQFFALKRGPGARLQRGAVVVYHPPDRESVVYVKRVIGLEGDVVEEARDGQLTVNGASLTKGPCPGPAAFNVTDGARCTAEVLAGRAWAVQRTPSGAATPGRWIVPLGAVFVVGDFRDNSLDSRHHGPVPVASLVGYAGGVWISFPPGSFVPRLDRIGALP